MLYVIGAFVMGRKRNVFVGFSVSTRGYIVHQERVQRERYIYIYIFLMISWARSSGAGGVTPGPGRSGS